MCRSVVLFSNCSCAFGGEATGTRQKQILIFFAHSYHYRKKPKFQMLEICCVIWMFLLRPIYIFRNNCVLSLLSMCFFLIIIMPHCCFILISVYPFFLFLFCSLYFSSSVFHFILSFLCPPLIYFHVVKQGNNKGNASENILLQQK